MMVWVGVEFRRRMVAVTGVALFLLLAAPSSAQQRASGDAKLPERPSGTMTGRVTNSAGEPLVGAIAYASPVGAIRSSQSAPVDGSGNFKIDGLEKGIYRVGASLPGYIPTPQPNGAEPSYYHEGDSVTVTMFKGSVISGTVTGPNNTPAVATTVRAVRVRDDEGKALSSPYVVRDRLTDDRGEYRIYGLPAGAYLIAAGGPPRFGGAAPGAYDSDAPTYFPSATRDTASEIIVRNGEEVTADVQYRGEPGHSISGTVAGTVQPQNQISAGSTIGLTDVRDRSNIMNAATSSFNNYAFSFYGVPDGEYELFASQYLPGRDYLRSGARRVTVRGADVTGLNLLLAPLASIAGRLVLENDPKAGCASRRETAAQETVISARRYQPETKPAVNPASKSSPLPEVPLLFTNSAAEAVPDANRIFTMTNLEPGTYRVDPRAPGSGWYVRSIAIGPAQTIAGRNSNLAVARDGITLKPGEHFSGLAVTITEGAAGLRGRISVPEGQSLPSRMRVYVVPAERDSAENVLRFFEARAENNGNFTIESIAPGRYWILTRPTEESESGTIKLIRRDGTLRAQVLREAEALKKEIPFKSCEQTTDYDLAYSPAAAPKQ